MRGLNFIEINYHHHAEFIHPQQVIIKHLPSNLWTREASSHLQITLVKHLRHSGSLELDGIGYRFFQEPRFLPAFSLPANRFAAGSNPDIILVQGFIFPTQVLMLRRLAGKGVKILLQHHGEQPFRRKRILQKWMGSVVDGWLFSSRGNAEEWIKSKIIKHSSHCYEVPPASTFFKKTDKSEARKMLGLPGGLLMLWVGRINRNKDPFTVVKAFRQFLQAGKQAHLYLIYGENELEGGLVKEIEEDEMTRSRVHLVGRTPYLQMEEWYNACDFFISASHREGGSYAVMEAMACGCIPIVSEIPASLEMIGDTGFHFPAGDNEALFKLMMELDRRAPSSQKVMDRFSREMSPPAVARKMEQIFEDVLKG